MFRRLAVCPAILFGRFGISAHLQNLFLSALKLCLIIYSVGDRDFCCLCRLAHYTSVRTLSSILEEIASKAKEYSSSLCFMSL